MNKEKQRRAVGDEVRFLKIVAAVYEARCFDDRVGELVALKTHFAPRRGSDLIRPELEEPQA